MKDAEARQIIVNKENIPKLKTFLDQEKISYEIRQEPVGKFKKPRPVKIDIFSDYGEALKDKELEAEKRLLEEMDDEED